MVLQCVRWYMNKPNFAKTLKLVYMAVFVALSIVLRTFAVWGTSRITFDFVTVILAGAFLGPIAGLTVGAITDTLAFLINNWGMPWTPVFLITSSLTGLIAGLVFKFLKVIKNDYIKLGIIAASVFILVPLILNPIGIYYILFAGLHPSGMAFGAWYLVRLPEQTIAYLIGFIVLFAVFVPVKQAVRFSEKLKPQKNQPPGDSA